MKSQSQIIEELAKEIHKQVIKSISITKIEIVIAMYLLENSLKFKND